MIDDDFLPYFPELVETNPELFSPKDLQDLEETIAKIEKQSDEEAEETLADFYIAHRQIRDELRKLLQERGVDKVPPKSNNQTGVANSLQELSEKLEKLKAKQQKEFSSNQNQSGQK